MARRGLTRIVLGGAIVAGSLAGGAPIGALLGAGAAISGVRAMRKKSGLKMRAKASASRRGKSSTPKRGKGMSRSQAASIAAKARWHGGGGRKKK